MKIAKITLVESYIETLRVHPEKTTLIYPLPKPTSYNGFHNAKARLKKLGKEFDFQVITTNGKGYLKVKRTK